MPRFAMEDVECNTKPDAAYVSAALFIPKKLEAFDLLIARKSL